MLSNYKGGCQVCIARCHTGRAVRAGPAGPAAAGPIFGQLTRAKMPCSMSFGELFNCCSKSSYARRDLG